MKRLLIFAVFYLCFAVCDVARSQMQIDSVVIETKNIPVEYHSHQHYGHDRNDVNYDGERNVGERRVILNPERLPTGSDTLVLIHGVSVWNSDGVYGNTNQNFSISIDSNQGNTLSVKYFESTGNSVLSYTLGFNKTYSYFDGSVNIISLYGSTMNQHNVARSYHGVAFGIPVVTTDHYLKGIFLDSSFISVKIYSSQPLGIAKHDKVTYFCYPNPASNRLTVTSFDDQEKIHIFDPLGREVHIPEISRTDESVSFNTSSLIPGIYWLRAGSQTHKIIIKR